MPKLKPGHISPTPAEDAAIAAAALADPDAPVLTDAEWEAIKPTLRRGRPLAAQRKQAVTLRADPDILAHLRASGPGWQTRVNALLREAVDGGRL